MKLFKLIDVIQKDFSGTKLIKVDQINLINIALTNFNLLTFVIFINFAVGDYGYCTLLQNT